MSGYLYCLVSLQTLHGEEKCCLFVIFLSLGKCHGKAVAAWKKFGWTSGTSGREREDGCAWHLAPSDSR